MKFNFSGLLCFVFSSSLKTATNIYLTRLHMNPLDDGFYIIFHSVSSPHFTAWLGIPLSCLHHPCQDKENLPWFRNTYSIDSFDQWSYQAVYNPTKYINVIFYLIILTHPQDINPKVVWVGFLPRFGAQCEQLRAFGARTPVNCTKSRPRMGIVWVLWKRPKYPKTACQTMGRLCGCNFAQCALTCKSNESYEPVYSIVWRIWVVFELEPTWKLWALH